MGTRDLKNAALVLLALLFLAGGCSSSGDDDDDATDATPGGEITADDVPGMVDDCNPESDDACEVFICSLAEVVQECEEAGVEEACEPVLSCVADYYNCVCGTGTYQYDVVAGCNETYLTCLADAGYGAY